MASRLKAVVYSIPGARPVKRFRAEGLGTLGDGQGTATRRLWPSCRPIVAIALTRRGEVPAACLTRAGPWALASAPAAGPARSGPAVLHKRVSATPVCRTIKEQKLSEWKQSTIIESLTAVFLIQLMLLPLMVGGGFFISYTLKEFIDEYIVLVTILSVSIGVFVYRNSDKFVIPKE